MSDQKPPTDNMEQQRRRDEELIANAMSMRSEFLRRFIEPRRDIEDECGYPKLGTSISVKDYKNLYDRCAVANRVVTVLPEESWQVAPLVYEDEDSEKATPFEEAWDAICNSMGEGSYYNDDSGSTMYERLKRIDKLSRIGSFGIILFGFDDGKPLDQPIDGVMSEEEIDSESISYPQGTEEQYLPQPRFPATETVDGLVKKQQSKQVKLLYMRQFSEASVQITQWEANINSPRFQMPIRYTITLNNQFATSQIGTGVTQATLQVHWTRVVPIADNLEESEVIGTPAMQPVIDNILGLKKLYGGSPEMYWRGAFPGISFETNPALGGDVKIDKEGTRDMVENYQNGLQRYLLLMGMTAKTLSPQVVDPTPQIAVQIEAICICLGIPIRVFKGSERGELASSQDDAAWNDRLKLRQNYYISPRIIAPVINRLIQVGVLPEPSKKGKDVVANARRKGKHTIESKASGWLITNKETKATTFVAKSGFRIQWPDISSQTNQEKATVALTKTQALAAYIGGGCDAIMAPMDYLTRELLYTEDEATTILDNSTKHQEEKQTDDMDKQKQMIDEGLAPDPTAPKVIVPGQQPPPMNGNGKPPTNGNPFGKQSKQPTAAK